MLQVVYDRDRATKAETRTVPDDRQPHDGDVARTPPANISSVADADDVEVDDEVGYGHGV